MERARNTDNRKGEGIKPIRLLVFPLDMDKAKEAIAFARTLALEVVGASSVMSEVEAAPYAVDSFCQLPFVTDPTFETALLALVESQSITHVYTPHGVIWTHLIQKQGAEPERFCFHLCQPSPYEEEWLRLQPSHIWAEQLQADRFVESLGLPGNGPLRSALRRGKMVSLHRQFVNIPGQCDDLKLMALAHIFRVVPSGDLVEIGSFQGRSAFAIGWLARHYSIGNLICVDPWDNSKVEDQGNQARLVNSELQRGRELVDFEKIFQSFIGAISLLDNASYIRETSEEAVKIYQKAVAAGYLPENELDALPVTGQLALLHIDGNHRYDHVRRDIDLWLPWVKPGGWVLLDDYVWAFGDGPKRAGDELLQTDLFDVAFTATDTLFLRRKQQ